MTRTLTTQSALEANLRSLGERNSDLARRLVAASPRPDVSFVDTPQEVPAAILDGTALCSRHRPLDEADRLAGRVDLVEHAVVVVLGFGAGYHVQRLAERAGTAGVIVVFEPDVALLRAVLERIDHSGWLAAGQVLFVTDAADRGGLARKLDGAESIIAQGVEFLEHPPSRRRLGDASGTVAKLVSEHVDAARITLSTTLMRSVDTVRNLLLNVDHYAAGAGITELQGAAAGHPAIVVSAGPSLARQMPVLARPETRQRSVVIAAQTTLRPLLDAGVRPHFVTALDYHAISRRFYEGLDAEATAGTTLVAEPKAHPVILDSFPGPVRCCANSILDMVLGPLTRPMGELPAGATVAHLAVYLARWLGCSPIILVGQDLAFTDGLYYTPGTAIDDVWASELNPFNTIEMMQWQRIVRHRTHLSRTTDVHGRPVFTDAQMTTYLQQFERDFAAYREAGVQILDATEGGLPKQHAEQVPLATALERHATTDLPPLPLPERGLDSTRRDAARQRVSELIERVDALGETSTRTVELLQLMLRDQDDPARMQKHFRGIERCRAEVDRDPETFRLVNHLNQLGVFKRFKADRKLHVRRDLEPRAFQRAQLERDLDNVTWTVDAAREMGHQLALAGRTLEGVEFDVEAETNLTILDDDLRRTGADVAATPCVAALVPLDSRQRLGESVAGRPLLQATLERLGRVGSIDSIVLLCPPDLDVEPMLDRSRIGRPVHVETCTPSPFGPEHVAVAAARRWASTCWRGGVGGMSVFDEVLCPAAMHAVMTRRGLTAGLLVGPDWPLLDPALCDAIVARHLELPAQHKLVFSQAPPGLAGCVLDTDVMGELTTRNRLSTIGALLAYQPHIPQHDPIARSVNVQVDHGVRRSGLRAVFDGPHRQRLATMLDALDPDANVDAIVAALDETQTVVGAPPHVILELTTRRRSNGLFRAGRRREAVDLDVPTALARLRAVVVPGATLLTLDGDGDPLLHDRFDEVVRDALELGVAGVHVRTELHGEGDVIERLAGCGADVVSVDLQADTPDTYRRMMGTDGLEAAVENLRRLVELRPALTGHAGAAGLALPWLVPRIERRAETLGDIEGFFDRWQGALGAAAIDPADPADDTLLPTRMPDRVAALEASRTTVIRV